MSREEMLAAMHGLVREAAGPALPGESVKCAIGRAAKRLGMPYSRAFDHWYQRARSLPAIEWQAALDARFALRQAEIRRLESRLAELTGAQLHAGPRTHGCGAGDQAPGRGSLGRREQAA